MLRPITHFLVQSCFACLLLWALPAHAKTIDFSDFKVVGNPSGYQINTRVQFELTDYLKEALLNGVALKARVQFRLIEHSSWWFNKDTKLLTVTYQLKYHALSQHFLLSRSDTNEHWNFSNLPSALRKLNALQKYILPDITDATGKGEGDFYLLAVADMIPATIDLPVRIQSYFSDEYQLNSEGVLWPLP